MSEVAETLGIEGPSLVRIVDALIADGLITRRTDPADKRAKLLALTPYGEQQVPAMEAMVEHVEARFRAEFSAEEFAVMLRYLERLEQIIPVPSAVQQAILPQERA